MPIRKIKTCFVDDHPMMLRGLADVIAGDPRIDVVASVLGGRAATMEDIAAMPALDVAVIDVKMPDVDGFEIMKLVGSLFPDVKVLAYSAFAGLDLIRRAVDCGASGFVHKSADVAVLTEAIERVHRQGVFFCSQSLGLISSDLKGVTDQSLTAREQEILEFLKRGLSNKDISETLFISYSTARFHIKNIYRKLGVSGRSQLPD